MSLNAINKIQNLDCFQVIETFFERIPSNLSPFIIEVFAIHSRPELIKIDSIEQGISSSRLLAQEETSSYILV